MTLLLDTNVLSEWQKQQPHESVVRFGTSIDPSDSVISVVSIAELGYGIARLPLGRKRSELEIWLSAIETNFVERVLPIDLETARIWGSLTARIHKSGTNIQAADGWIAATAIRYRLQLATRNVRDFAETGVPLVNPWDF